MKVCIVTLYKSCNSGSYLQAYALKKHLENTGNEVSFLKISYPLKTVFQEQILKKINKFIKSGYNEFKKYNDSIKRFKKLQKNLNIINFSKASKKEDVFIYGSDTIWDIDRQKLFKLRDVFFGIKLKNKKKVAYAATFANTKYENVIKHKDIVDGLNDFYSIGVRDMNSALIVDKISSKKSVLVCDPTLLLQKKDYDLLTEPKEKSKYIFIYIFEDLSYNQINDIKEFAKSNNLKICGIGNFNWFDKKVSNYPENFLSYIKYSDYIITDTFHGTIFSTIFNKNYIVINRNKNKVNDFLEKCDLTDRLVDNQKISISFDKKIEYEKVNQLLENFRKESIDFLNNSIKK